MVEPTLNTVIEGLSNYHVRIALLCVILAVAIRLVAALVVKKWWGRTEEKREGNVKPAEVPKEKDLVTWKLIDTIPTVFHRETPEDLSLQSKFIVMDIGYHTLKVGRVTTDLDLAVNMEPELVVPAVTGINKHLSMRLADQMYGHEDFYFGKEALERRSVLKLEYPFIHLKNTDTNKLKDKLELFTQHCVKKLVKKDDSYKALVIAGIEPTKCSEALIESFGRTVFESFDFDRVAFVSQHSMALYSAGIRSGIVVNVGASQTTAVPFYEGLPITSYSKSTAIGGNHLDTILSRLLLEYNNGTNIGTSSSELEVLREMKEKACYVSLTKPTSEDEDGNDEKYPCMLPDRRLVYLTKERYLCPEYLFNPNFNPNFFHIPAQNELANGTSTNLGVVELVYNIISQMKEKVDNFVFDTVAPHVVLCGASTKFKNFEQRFCNDLNDLIYPLQVKVTVYGRSARENSAYVGAQMFCRFPPHILAGKSVTRDEYYDVGTQAIKRKLC